MFFKKKVLTKISCYSAVDIVISVMVYNVDTSIGICTGTGSLSLLRCCSVRIAGSVLNTKS